MTLLTTGQRETLEAMVDAVGFAETLQALAHIAGLKAQHVEENWQDATLARALDKVAQLVVATADRVARVGLPT